MARTKQNKRKKLQQGKGPNEKKAKKSRPGNTRPFSAFSNVGRLRLDQLLDLQDWPSGFKVGLTDGMPSFTAIKMPIVRMMIQVIRDVDKIPDNVQMKYLCQFSPDPAILYQSIMGKVRQRKVSFCPTDPHFVKIFKHKTEEFVTWLNGFLESETRKAQDKTNEADNPVSKLNNICTSLKKYNQVVPVKINGKKLYFETPNKYGPRMLLGKTKKNYKPEFRLAHKPPEENVKKGLITALCVMGEVETMGSGATMNIAQRQAAKEMVELLSKHSDIEKSKPNPVSSTPTGSSTAAQSTLSRLKKLAAPTQSAGEGKGMLVPPGSFGQFQESGPDEMNEEGSDSDSDSDDEPCLGGSFECDMEQSACDPSKATDSDHEDTVRTETVPFESEPIKEELPVSSVKNEAVEDEDEDCSALAFPMPVPSLPTPVPAKRPRLSTPAESPPQIKLPPGRDGYITVWSNTLWIGNIAKQATQAHLSDLFGKFGRIQSVRTIPPRGCAFVCMKTREDAQKTLEQILWGPTVRLCDKPFKITWAAGNELLTSQWPHCWNPNLGCSYIPKNQFIGTFGSLAAILEALEKLECGGTIDKDTLPAWIKCHWVSKNSDEDESALAVSPPKMDVQTSPKNLEENGPALAMSPVKTKMETSPPPAETPDMTAKGSYGFPPVKKDHISVCSHILLMSRVSKKATTKDVHDALSSYKILGSKHKLKNDFSIVFRGGNVFIRTKTRGAAYTALSRFNKISKTESIKIDGRPVKLTWSPANETLEKGWMRHWDDTVGCSYIPVNEIGLISAAETLGKLGEGGTIDQQSVPERFKNLMPSNPASYVSTPKEVTQPASQLNPVSNTSAAEAVPVPSFPPVKQGFISVCSHSLVISGVQAKGVTAKDVLKMFHNHEVFTAQTFKVNKNIRGVANVNVTMKSWEDAKEALSKFKGSSQAKLADQSVEVTWGPVRFDNAFKKTVASKWNKQWDASLGCSYIPASDVVDMIVKAKSASHFWMQFAQGGSVDEKSVPQRLKELYLTKVTLPPVKKDLITVCSNTLCFGGGIPAPSVTAKVIQDLFYKNKLACAKTVKVVKAKGVATAYAQMHSRGDAQKAMERLNETKEILGGKHVKVTWTQTTSDDSLDKKLEGHWVASSGCSYIPVSDIEEASAAQIFEILGKCWAIDEDSVPERLKKFLPPQAVAPSISLIHATPTRVAFPSVRADCITVCSHTLYVGSGIFHTKSVSHVKDVLKEHGLEEPLATQVVKGKKRQDDKVYIEMGDRETAEEALSKLTTSDEENEQKKLTLTWALNPSGPEELGKKWFRYWDHLLGCSFIPVNEIGHSSMAIENLKKLGQNGTIDQDSIPGWIQDLIHKDCPSGIPGIAISAASNPPAKLAPAPVKKAPEISQEKEQKSSSKPFANFCLMPQKPSTLPLPKSTEPEDDAPAIQLSGFNQGNQGKSNQGGPGGPMMGGPSGQMVGGPTGPSMGDDAPAIQLSGFSQGKSNQGGPGGPMMGGPSGQMAGGPRGPRRGPMMGSPHGPMMGGPRGFMDHPMMHTPRPLMGFTEQQPFHGQQGPRMGWRMGGPYPF